MKERKGVTFHIFENCWRADIHLSEYENYHLGSFSTKEKAELVYGIAMCIFRVKDTDSSVAATYNFNPSVVFDIQKALDKKKRRYFHFRNLLLQSGKGTNLTKLLK